MLKPCCETCPEYGMNGSMAPSPYEMTEAVKAGIVWMCHSNHAVPCWATGLAKLREGDVPVKSEGDFWEKVKQGKPNV
jgi:hypothetical protein